MDIYIYIYKYIDRQTDRQTDIHIYIYIYMCVCVYCYADDIGLFVSNFVWIKIHFEICEDYVLKHKIIFNASKSQLLYFPSNTAKVPKDFMLKDIMLKMKSGQVLPYHLDTCNYLGNTICSHDEIVIIVNAITDMNIRLNNLLAAFSHCDSGTLSTLFRTYCINIIGENVFYE